MANNPSEMRSYPITCTRGKYYSVELTVNDSAFAHQFKLWDMAVKGTCLLVKENSTLLNHLKAGDILDMKYYAADSAVHTEFLKTKIRYISKDEKGRFKGHYLIGISFFENQDQASGDNSSEQKGKIDKPLNVSCLTT